MLPYLGEALHTAIASKMSPMTATTNLFSCKSLLSDMFVLLYYVGIDEDFYGVKKKPSITSMYHSPSIFFNLISLLRESPVASILAFELQCMIKRALSP